MILPGITAMLSKKQGPPRDACLVLPVPFEHALYKVVKIHRQPVLESAIRINQILVRMPAVERSAARKSLYTESNGSSGNWDGRIVDTVMSVRYRGILKEMQRQ